MGETLQVLGFACDDDHVTAQVGLRSGQAMAVRWCPGQDTALDEAVATFSDALERAALHALVSSVPEVPDAPPEQPTPCRMCGAARVDNTTDGRGYTWCAEHREYARDN